ncbi:hypothetical protein HMPREF3036_01093 [Sutterella sp. KLE1602]|nr:hypothetical protein HMPREF3036_01093 [Sutterella sp. KLE1602]
MSRKQAFAETKTGVRPKVNARLRLGFRCSKPRVRTRGRP